MRRTHLNALSRSSPEEALAHKTALRREGDFSGLLEPTLSLTKQALRIPLQGLRSCFTVTGVDAIETDVQMTKDGKLVLFHDARIERTTNGRGWLQHLAWDELRGLDAGSWFHRRYTGERIPLLTEFLQKYGRRIPQDAQAPTMSGKGKMCLPGGTR
jgi:Glycerophosphoryl diester phosphodiesterase family